MNGIGIIRKFIGSHFLLERLAREVIERLPLGIHYRLYYGKTFLHWSAFLKASQYWDKEKLEAFQIEQLRSLLEHVSRHVPYYRKLFADYGINVRQIQSPDDMRVIPLLTKETVRDRPHDFVAENIPPGALIKTNTSGSTGIPLAIYKTRESDEKLHAYHFDLKSRVGFDSKKRTVFFKRRAITMGGKKSISPSIRCGNKLYFSTRDVSDSWMQRCYDMVKKFRPEFVSGVRTPLLALALFIKERELPPFHGLRAVLTYAETIFPWQKKIIEESFNARLFSYYGMYEGAVMGGACEHSDQCHMYPQYGMTEFINVNGNYPSPILLSQEEGVRGRVSHEIIGTGFRNYAMPFIRYRTGDLAEVGPDGCSLCGRNFQLVEQIAGRINEFLMTKDLKTVYTSLSAFEAHIFENVKQVQFYQDEPGIAYLRIMRKNRYTDADTLTIIEQIAERFNLPETRLEIKVVFVDAVERTSEGKTPGTVQKIDIKDFVRL